MGEPEWIYAFEDMDDPSEKLCRKCGKNYESYVIFVADSKKAAVIHTHLENQFENLCRDCRESLSKELTEKNGDNH